MQGSSTRSAALIRNAAPRSNKNGSRYIVVFRNLQRPAATRSAKPLPRITKELFA